MRKIIYKGSKPASIIQFGRVVTVMPGQRIGFFEHEWDMLCKEGSPPPEYVEQVEPDPVELFLPLGTPGVDLRKIPWSNKKLYVLLMTRSSAKYVQSIA